MNNSDSLKSLDRQISVVADLMDQYRTRIREMERDGRNADPALSALDALNNVYRRRLLDRLALQESGTSRAGNARPGTSLIGR